jgi:transposase
MDQKLFVGMDLHKRTSNFCVKDRDGDKIVEKKILTDRAQVTEFIRSLRNDNLSVAMEPVSQWYVYADLLESLGCDVHLAHPMKVKAIASARIKTDAIDASVLCDLLRTNLLPEAYFSPKEVRSWKEIVRHRASLMNLRTQTKNKVHAILHKQALIHQFTNLFGVGGRCWLEALVLPSPFKENLTEYLALIDRLTELIDAAEERVEAAVKDHAEAKLLTTIPGISFVSALTIMGEIGEIRRFPSAKKLMGYAGIVPSTYSSGDKARHGKITKTGSKWLRYVMIEVAQHQQMCKRIPGFGAYYRSLKARKGTNPATVATARKLLAVIWRILTDKRPFSVTPPNRHGGAPTSKVDAPKGLAELLSSPASAS